MRKDKTLAFSKRAAIAREAENWRREGGVAGGWDCLLNSSCEHLSEGEERGWHFEGDESFDSYGPAKGSAATTTTGERGVRRIEDTNEHIGDGPKL